MILTICAIVAATVSVVVFACARQDANNSEVMVRRLRCQCVGTICFALACAIGTPAGEVPDDPDAAEVSK